MSSPNAFWDGSAQQFYFSDGDGTTADPLTSFDIIAHEYYHAITDNTSKLVYFSESGALNEGYSDIYSAIVELSSQPDGRSVYPGRNAGHGDWLVGEDCWLGTDPLRDMKNPQRCNQPSYYLGTKWYYGSGDKMGVHYNSGVPNFAFYLLAEGGTGTNDGHPYSITGTGLDTARLVAMYANLNLLTSNSNFADARDKWIQSASVQNLNAHTIKTVKDVWIAVGVTR